MRDDAPVGRHGEAGDEDGESRAEVPDLRQLLAIHFARGQKYRASARHDAMDGWNVVGPGLSALQRRGGEELGDDRLVITQRALGTLDEGLRERAAGRLALVGQVCSLPDRACCASMCARRCP